MEKRLYKICEAVVLGLDGYYMSKWVKQPLTEKDRAEALLTLPTLPDGWMHEPQELNVCYVKKTGGTRQWRK